MICTWVRTAHETQLSLVDSIKYVKIKGNFAKMVILPLSRFFTVVWPLNLNIAGDTVHISVFFSQGA